MPADNLLYILKYVYLALIYLFLLQIILLIRADVRRQRASKKASSRPGPALEIIVGSELIDGAQDPLISLSGTLIAGRDASCDIQISDASVSGRHAQFTVKDRRCVVEDLGSTNGTFINDIKLEGKAELAKDDIVKIGMVSFQYRGDQQ